MSAGARSSFSGHTAGGWGGPGFSGLSVRREPCCAEATKIENISSTVVIENSLYMASAVGLLAGYVNNPTDPRWGLGEDDVVKGRAEDMHGSIASIDPEKSIIRRNHSVDDTASHEARSSMLPQIAIIKRLVHGSHP